MTNTTETAPALGLNDLALALQIIETAIQRGAFQPKELVPVGQTHEKLSAFLEYQAKLAAAAQSANGETTGPEPVAEPKEEESK